MSAESSQIRAKTSCWPCRQRKVKCSKNPMPCKNCVRRGEQSACVVEFQSFETQTSRTVVNVVASPENQELLRLQQKVAELETELQIRKNPSLLSSPISNGPVLNQPWASERPTTRPLNDDCQTQASETLIAEDAASILEFLAWGRQKNPNYYRLASPEVTRSILSGDNQGEPGSLDEDSLDSLQMLLPSRKQVWQLIDYSDKNLLWFHGSYMPWQFKGELQRFYDNEQGCISRKGVNLQWVALLFSILTSSLVCAPRSQSTAWGFRAHEQGFLGQKWSATVMTLLNKAAYTANHSIYSVQAITTSTMSAHLLGHSNMQSIHLAAAVRIAQAIGLHKLTSDSKGTDTGAAELGRRVWQQLCSQDWFNIPFSETYLINPLYSRSEPPMNCIDDGNFVPLPESAATSESYTRFLAKIAALMPHLLDDMTSCNTIYSKYHRVMAWDKQLRALASDRPPMLSNQTIKKDWPSFTEWARRSLAISSSHKIIMVHRSFLSESFRNHTFDFTRRTCIAASKTIIKEFKIAVEDSEMPTFWTYHAFAVAASIILLLDAFHRSLKEREYIEHMSLVRDTAALLGDCQNSMIASRGARLLSGLMQNDKNWRDWNTSRTTSACGSRKRTLCSDLGDSSGDRPSKRGPGFDMTAFVEDFRKQHGNELRTGDSSFNIPHEQPIRHRGYAQPYVDNFRRSSIMLATEHLNSSSGHSVFTDTISRQMSVPSTDSLSSFESLLYLASHDFSII
ncbi:proline utilization trans-activator [Microdochium nivale]|nr:proline utilization trans-activator [Microdochium nivale]